MTILDPPPSLGAVSNCTQPSAPPTFRGRMLGLEARQYVVYAGFLAVVAFFAITLHDDGFTSTDNIQAILEQTAPISVMAVATVFVLSAGEIDLSMGSVVALSALVAASVLQDGSPFPVAAAAGLGAGAAVGLVNGLMVTRLRVPSFLVTLGTMGLVAGVAQRSTNLASVPTLDGAFNDVLGGGELFGVSTLIIWTVVAVAVGHIALRHTRTGAHVLASGDDSGAAEVSGVRVARVKLGVLVLSAVAAALAGLLYTGRLGGATYTLGGTDLLTVIAAVVIGGTRLFGGVGSVIGALAGSLLLGVVNNGLILSGLTNSEQQIAQGFIILAAVALTLREPRR